MKDCKHIAKSEIHKGVLHLQRCQSCGSIREYNPEKKNVLIINDPDRWSEWVEPSPLVDKLFNG